ncbi:SBBP repeat-containing protein [Desulfurococcaceae archaeon MEX13E-LK6-19]|nr:SBBP repeat-containing protein [Desulfurococcaceae archaeon MEX13E-LK6-19]
MLRLKSYLTILTIILAVLATPLNADSGTQNGYATWFLTIGGTGAETPGNGITLDYRNNVYITGTTLSWSNTTKKAFVAKVDPLGRLIFSIIFGGNSDDEAYDIAVKGTDYMYVAGSTYSFGAGGRDAYITKIDRFGNIIWYVTLGGSQADSLKSLKQGSDNYLYATGYTRSFGAGSSDVLVVKLSENGSLIWALTIGGPYSDEANGLYLDNENNIYIVGKTASYGYGIYDAFVAKISSKGSLLWFKVIGTSESDEATAITLDENETIYVAGWTLNTTTDTIDAFVAKILPDENRTIEWIKMFGGDGDDIPYGIKYYNGKIYVTGFTTSYSATDTDQGDIFVARIDAKTGNIDWFIVIGGSEYDSSSAVTVVNDNIYITGSTTSFSSGSEDLFLAKLEDAYLSTLSSTENMIWVDNGYPNNVTLSKKTVPEYDLSPTGHSKDEIPIIITITTSLVVQQQTNVVLNAVIPIAYIATPTGEYPTEVITVTKTKTVTLYSIQTVTSTTTTTKEITTTVTTTVTSTTTEKIVAEVTTINLVNVTTITMMNTIATETVTVPYTATKTFTTTSLVTTTATITETQPTLDLITLSGVATVILIVGLIVGFIMGRGGVLSGKPLFTF